MLFRHNLIKTFDAKLLVSKSMTKQFRSTRLVENLNLFPGYQVTRQIYFLRFTSFPEYVIIFCKILVKLSNKGATDTSTFLINRIKDRISNVLYALD